MTIRKNIMGFLTQKIVEIYLTLALVSVTIVLINIAANYAIGDEAIMESLYSTVFIPSYATLFLLAGITMVAELVANLKKEGAESATEDLRKAVRVINCIMEKADYQALARYISCRFMVNFYDLLDYIRLKHEHHKQHKSAPAVSYWAKRISLGTNNRHLMIVADGLYTLLGEKGRDRFLEFTTNCQIKKIY